MISKNKQKLIHSLSIKKYRDQHGLFIAEGSKLIHDLYKAGAKISYLAATAPWLAENSIKASEIVEASEQSLKAVSQLKTATSVIGIIEMPKTEINPSTIKNQLVIGLDGLQDPGNMGTIIRMANWFGIHTIVCSTDTVDCFNPKVVQATMGAVYTTKIIYVDLEKFIDEHATDGWNVFGTFLDGKNIYGQSLPNRGLIILGNEGNGISPNITKMVSQRLFIPYYSDGLSKPESLNVSVAASIICSEFRRQALSK